MKKYLFILAALVCTTACVTRTTVIRERTVVKKDNGKHKGWYKNPKNPHNPGNGGNNTTVIVQENNVTNVKSNGNGNGRGNGKGKGNGNGKGNGKGKGPR